MNAIEREAQILEAIKKSMPMPPTLRELCDKTGVTSTSQMSYFLSRLEDKGLIERLPNKARGILLKKRVTT